MAIQEKRKLFMIWKNGGDKEEYLVAKCRARKEVYKAKKSVQNSLSNVINNADSRGEILRIAKQMISQNKHLIGEQCVKDDMGNVQVDHGEIRNAWMSYYEHLLNEEFPWNRDILEAVEPV